MSAVLLISMFILGALFMFYINFIIILYLSDHAEDAEIESEVEQ